VSVLPILVEYLRHKKGSGRISIPAARRPTETGEE
jgi:hypothetical protein